VRESVPTRYEDADELLVLAAKGGDAAAMDVLLDKYRNLVKTRARSFFIMGADRDDVFQEGMIGLFKAVRDFRSEKLSNFRAFATLCVNRQIMTALKAATRQKHVALNTSVSLHRPVFDDGAVTLLDIVESPRSVDPLDRVIRQETDGAVQRCMRERLSDFERGVLSLYLDGKTYREISDLLERGPKAVDNALQRIKRKIKQRLPQQLVPL
jgi:RNA polymerase sporulation-specific sigma factor